MLSIAFLPLFIYRLYEIYKMRHFPSYMKNPMVRLQILLNVIGVISSLADIVSMFMPKPADIQTVVSLRDFDF